MGIYKRKREQTFSAWKKSKIQEKKERNHAKYQENKVRNQDFDQAIAKEKMLM